MKMDTSLYETKMNKSIDSYKESLSVIRVGRANASVLNGINVEYYGVETPINQVAEVKVTDPRTLMITPWDPSVLRDIERAIQASQLGINPQNDGKCLRIAFPPLTEERRKELKKQVSKMGEDAKVAIRNIRRDGVEKSRDLKKNSEITEDEQKQAEKDMQDLTDKYVKKVDEVTAQKDAEIMEI